MSSGEPEVCELASERAKAEMAAALHGLFEVFASRRRRRVRFPFECDYYVPIVRDDGSIDFVLDSEHTKIKRWLDENVVRVDVPEVDL